jgi:transposase
MADCARASARAIRREVALTDFYLTDERWALIASRIPGKDSDPGCHGRDNRLFIEAVFWIARTGTAWRRLPPRFGKWYTIYTRCHRWTQKQVWPDVMNALATDKTCEYFYDEGTIRYAPSPRPVAAQKAAESPPEAQGGSEGAAASPSRRSRKRERPAFGQRKAQEWRARSLRRQSRGRSQ